MKICKYCNKDFLPKHHGGTKEFCTQKCANTYQNKHRVWIAKPAETKKCSYCEKEYKRNKRYSATQWKESRYCSWYCNGLDHKIHDEYKDRGERHRRKRGSLKRYTPEWLEMIKANTKNAMQKPEVKLKLHKPKGEMSIEARIQISNALAGKLPKNMMYGSSNHDHILRGDYDCSKGTMYFRSKWEANYALYLDFLVEKEQIKNWEYEADVFMFEEVKIGTRSYRPDFKIFNFNGSIEYHEVKGYMDSKSKTKLRRMLKYYPEIKLVLIERDAYTDIKKKLGKALNFY